MAAPVDAGRVGTNGTTSNSSHAVNIPASLSNGDLLIAVVRHNAAATLTWPGDWTVLLSDTSDPSDDVTEVGYHVVDGSEGSTFTVSASGSARWEAICWQITGAESPDVQAPEIGTIATATSTNPNPGSVTPTGGPKDFLYLAVAAKDGENNPSTAPTGYSNLFNGNSGIAGSLSTNGTVAGASKQTTGSSSEDPGTFSASNSNWTAFTIAVHPAAAGTHYDQTPADTITLSDSVALTVKLGKADSITLSDNFARVWSAVVSRADTISLSDAAGKSLAKTAADSLTLSDNISVQIILILLLGDTLSLSDGIAKATGLSRADSLTLTDNLSRAWAAIRSLADTVTLSDAVAKGIRQALTDTIGTSDAFGKADTKALADTTTLADALSKAYGVSRADAVSLADSAVKALGLPRADQVTLTDVLTKVVAHTAADTLTLTDDINVILTPEGGLTLSLSDTITLTDAIVKGLGLPKNDIVHLADSTARALNGLFIEDGGGGGVDFRKIILDRFGIY